jgi:hypothetical protein
MKMVVEVEDFYLDEDSNLEEGLKSYVTKQVLADIALSIKSRVNTQILVEVKTQVENSMYKQINLFISDFIKTGLVPSSRDSKKMIPIQEYITEKFAYNSGWASPDETIKKIAEKFGNELKQRYDIAFANQIVRKMNEVGLLKEESIIKLLESKETTK